MSADAAADVWMALLRALLLLPWEPRSAAAAWRVRSCTASYPDSRSVGAAAAAAAGGDTCYCRIVTALVHAAVHGKSAADSSEPLLILFCYCCDYPSKISAEMSDTEEIRYTRGRALDCPNLNPDDTNYEIWRKQAQVWRSITTYPKKKSGFNSIFSYERKGKRSYK